MKKYIIIWPDNIKGRKMKHRKNCVSKRLLKLMPKLEQFFIRQHKVFIQSMRIEIENRDTTIAFICDGKWEYVATPIGVDIMLKTTINKNDWRFVENDLYDAVAEI